MNLVISYFLLLLLLSYKRKRKRHLCAHTKWKQHMWHSDRNNNNTLTKQPALGEWNLSSTHNIQQQWQSTKTRIQLEQQWPEHQQQNLWTERWQMIQGWTAEDPSLADPQKGQTKYISQSLQWLLSQYGKDNNYFTSTKYLTLASTTNTPQQTQ